MADRRERTPAEPVNYNLPMPADLHARVVEHTKRNRGAGQHCPSCAGRSLAATMRLLLDDAMTMHDERARAAGE